MKSYTKYLWLNTEKRKEIVLIHPQVEQAVLESKIKEGFCLVSSMHITSSVYVNDQESGLYEDILNWVERIAPEDPSYKHHQTGEDNADAHLKRLLIGHQVILPITKGQLDLGPWERIFYAEFDGQRKKRVVIKIIGE